MAQENREHDFQHFQAAIIASCRDAIFAHGRDGRIVIWNRAAEELFGYSAAEAMGREATFLAPPHRAESARAHLERTLRGEETATLEGIAIARDGNGIEVEMSISCIRDGQGNVIGGMAVFRDIRERNRAQTALRASEHRYRHLFERNLAGVFRYSISDGLLEANEECARILGYDKPEDLLGFEMPDVFYDAADAAIARERLIREKSLSGFEVRLKRRDGSCVWVLENVNLVEDAGGGPPLIEGTFIDITEQRRAVEELRAARESAEAASRAKSEFLANMSHEVRTPMNGLMGMTELALALSENQEQREYLELALSSAGSLLALLDDILDLSRIEARKLSIEPIPFEPRELLKDVSRLLETTARGKGLRLQASCADTVPQFVTADPLRLRQVLVNLIGNAIKFTSEGYVEVHVDSDASASLLRLQIRDTGIGIPPDKQAAIFEAFMQVDGSIARQYGGAGLGLAISLRLVALMGGAIRVESAPGEGALFLVDVPFRPAEDAIEEPTPAAREQSATHGALRILLAEDNLINQRLALRVLEKAGHSVMVAANGCEAVDLAARQQFDIALMDVQMPEMNGLEATRLIRRRECGAHLPILALTAHAMTGDRERCLEAGMDGYLTKPVRVADLLREIARLGGIVPVRESETAPSREHQPG